MLHFVTFHLGLYFAKVTVYGIWASPRENLSSGVCEQQSRLISAFVIRVLENIISKHATSEILIF